jgi:hypothetical protein
MKHNVKFQKEKTHFSVLQLIDITELNSNKVPKETLTKNFSKTTKRTFGSS